MKRSSSQSSSTPSQSQSSLSSFFKPKTATPSKASDSDKSLKENKFLRITEPEIEIVKEKTKEVDLSPPKKKQKLEKDASNPRISVSERLQNLDIDPARHKRFTSKLGVRENERDQVELEDLGTQKKERKYFNTGPTIKYTPLEKQFLDFKKQHPDLLLLVENGYKYNFFGKDAEDAAKVLSIHCGWGKNFLTTMVPTVRLSLYVTRLVQAGFKVGVVSQMETRALKKIGDNKSKLFTRSISAIYTKSTLIGEDIDPLLVEPNPVSDSHQTLLDDMMEDEEKDGEGADIEEEEGPRGTLEVNFDFPQFTMGRFLMVLYERILEGSASSIAEKVEFALVAVQTSTGEIIFDRFRDGFLRSELETRLYQINPIEILIQEDITTQSEKLIRNFNPSKNKLEAVQIQSIPPSLFDFDKSKAIVEDLFSSKPSLKGRSSLRKSNSTNNLDNIEMIDVDDDSDDAEEIEILNAKKKSRETILRLDEMSVVAFGVIINYTNQFHLESLFFLECNYYHFSQRQYLRYDGNTMKNLEIMEPSTSSIQWSSSSKKGSLYWLLNYTSTAMGQRMLIDWIKHPLANAREIRLRLDAVDELKERSNENAEGFLAMVSKLPDLERGICRIFYKKCTIFEFVTVLKAFQTIEERKVDIGSFSSELLQTQMKRIPSVKKELAYFFDAMVSDSGTKDNSQHDVSQLFKPGAFPQLDSHKAEVLRIQQELQDHLKTVRTILGVSNIQYKTVLKEEYLVEVSRDKLGRVPNDWVEVSAVKAAKRYRTGFVAEKLEELRQWQERVALEGRACWSQFLSSFANSYEKFRSVVRVLATFDCLNSLATVARNEGYTKPVITDEIQFVVEGGRHPVVEALMTRGDYVSNDLSMPASSSCRALVITGPNMGGKTSFARQNALIAIMAQIGSFVPASRVVMSPLDAIFTRMGAQDALFQKQSTFMVELLEASGLLRQATQRSLVILDELGRGTSTLDGLAIAYATLEYLMTKSKPFVLFITHYPTLAQLSRRFPDLVRFAHMGYLKSQDDTSSVTFLYKLQDGVERHSFGLNVARLAQIPESIVDKAQEKSKLLEEEITTRQHEHYFKRLAALVNADEGRFLTETKDLRVDLAHLID